MRSEGSGIHVRGRLCPEDGRAPHWVSDTVGRLFTNIDNIGYANSLDDVEVEYSDKFEELRDKLVSQISIWQENGFKFNNFVSIIVI